MTGPRGNLTSLAASRRKPFWALCLVCSQMNFRQIPFSETQTTRKEPESMHPRLFYNGAVSDFGKMRGTEDERGQVHGRNPSSDCRHRKEDGNHQRRGSPPLLPRTYW